MKIHFNTKFYFDKQIFTSIQCAMILDIRVMTNPTMKTSFLTSMSLFAELQRFCLQ